MSTPLVPLLDLGAAGLISAHRESAFSGVLEQTESKAQEGTWGASSAAPGLSQLLGNKVTGS